MSKVTVDRPDGAGGARSGAGVIIRKAIVAVVVLGVVAGAVAVSVHWMKHPPTAERRPRGRTARLVEVREVEPRSIPVVVAAQGTVVPAREIDLSARVGGEIVALAGQLIPGGRFEAGERLVELDRRDYELAVRRAETRADAAAAEIDSAEAEIARCRMDLARAQWDLAMEMGAQAVARREYELMGTELDDGDLALVLREPQLRQAEAACEAAEAAVRKAEAARTAAVASREEAEVALAEARLDLARTTVRVPFNAAVGRRHVDVGAQVSASTPLASLVGTDEYWVVVSVPVDELRWIRIPGYNSDDGSPARVRYPAAWGDDAGRPGTVKQLLMEVEHEGRMARLLVSVPDPLHLAAGADERRPLILGGYVHVDIEGRTLDDVFRLDRRHLRDGHQVWVMGPDDRLEIRDVTVAWSGGDHVCVADGLAAGDRLVTSDLGAPVEGMLLRPAGPGNPKSEARNTKQTRNGQTEKPQTEERQTEKRETEKP